MYKIDTQKVSEDLYHKVIDLVGSDNSYPNDLIIDIQAINQYKPDNFMLFVKDYFSTSMFIVDNEHPYKNSIKEYYGTYLCLYNFYIPNLPEYKTCLHCFNGKIHEYDLKYDHNKIAVLYTMRFFYIMHYRRFISCLDDETDKDLKSKAEKDYSRNISTLEVLINKYLPKKEE